MSETPKKWRTSKSRETTQDWRFDGSGGGGTRSAPRGRGGGRGGAVASRGRGSSMHMFATRDMEPRNQHDMRAFVMAARQHAETQRLSEAISWLGDPLKFGLSRVMDICRKCSTDLDVDAGTAKDQVSFQRVFLPLIDLAVSTEFRNSPLRSETNILFSTLYKLEQAEGLWQKVFEKLEELAGRGTVEDWNYTEHDRRFENEKHHAVWEPSTWADVALPIARFMVEVTKRFRDEVLVDKKFQEQATKTLPALITKWKEGIVGAF